MPAKYPNLGGLHEFDPNTYDSNRIKVYPLHNRLHRGYGVADPDINPAGRSANGLFVNQRGDKISFWIEEMEANFAVAGTTAQSQGVRQFMPHNMVQPSITVTGRAPNNYQYNRMAAFVRASHWNALHTRQLKSQGIPIRYETISGHNVPVPTIRLIIRNSHQGKFPYNGRHVKGTHIPWAVEGYVKSMGAGGERFNQAPPFQFEFLISESLLKPSIGLWKDTRVFGSEIKPWLSFIKRNGDYVNVGKDSIDRPKGTHGPRGGPGGTDSDEADPAWLPDFPFG